MRAGNDSKPEALDRCLTVKDRARRMTTPSRSVRLPKPKSKPRARMPISKRSGRERALANDWCPAVRGAANVVAQHASQKASMPCCSARHLPRESKGYREDQRRSELLAHDRRCEIAEVEPRTGIPASKMMEGERQKLLHMAHVLERRKHRQTKNKRVILEFGLFESFSFLARWVLSIEPTKESQYSLSYDTEIRIDIMELRESTAVSLTPPTGRVMGGY